MNTLRIFTVLASLLVFTACESLENTNSQKAEKDVLPNTPTVSETFHQSPAEKKVMMIQLLDDQYKAGKMSEAEYDAKRQQILETY